MQHMLALNLMNLAIEKAPGIKVTAASPAAALKLRRQLYGVRRRMRQRADTTYDGLSILVHGAELSLIVREPTSGPMLAGVEGIAPLNASELPRSVGSRGPAKIGALEAAILQVLSQNGAIR